MDEVPHLSSQACYVRYCLRACLGKGTVAQRDILQVQSMFEQEQQARSGESKDMSQGSAMKEMQGAECEEQYLQRDGEERQD